MIKINNPYSELIKIFRTEGKHYNPPQLQLATVTSVNPLKIRLNDLEITKDNLLINADINNIKFENQVINVLNINDTVAVIPIQNMQTYIILCKVV